MRETAGNYREALDRYHRYMQRAVSCVSRSAVLYAGPAPLAGTPDLIALSSYEDPIRLTTHDGHPLALQVNQRGLVVDDEREDRRGEKRVTTLAYRYAIYGNAGGLGEPLVYWHWDAASQRPPHMHAPVADPGGRGMRLHLPSGPRRVSIEQIIGMLIDEWGVVPQREDWAETLADGQARYDAYRMQDRN